MAEAAPSIAEAFGGQPEPSAEEAAKQQEAAKGGASTQVNLDPPKDAGKPAGRPDYVPEDYWQASADDPTKGVVNMEAAFKALADTKSALGTANRDRAELQKAAGKGDTVPTDVQEYAKGFDLKKLAEAAPAFTGTDEQKKTLGRIFTNAHEAGVGVAAAHKMAFAHFKGEAEAVSAEKQREAAVKYLGPNGPTMVREVEAHLVAMNKRQEFTEDQRQVVASLAKSGAGLSFLYRMGRGQAPAPLPGADTKSTAEGPNLSMDAIRQAFASEKYASNPEYRKQIQDAWAAHQAGKAQQGSPDTSIRIGFI